MQKLKTKIKKLVSIVCVLMVASSILAAITIKVAIFVENPVKVYEVAPINVPEAKPLGVKEYIFKEVVKAGLNVEEVKCLIEHESNWANDCNANKNLSTDCGIWRINSVHKNSISFADRLDYKKATAWSIAKRLNEGNWSAWYGHSAGNCKSLARN